MSHPQRFQRTPLAAALGVALLPLVASPAQAQLEEVVVTATKQAESLQDVPISVNALSGDSLREQGIMTFDEYVNFLPNVVDAGNSPGMREIYIRGSATEQASVTVSSAQGSAPGVANERAQASRSCSNAAWRPPRAGVRPICSRTARRARISRLVTALGDISRT